MHDPPRTDDKPDLYRFYLDGIAYAIRGEAVMADTPDGEDPDPPAVMLALILGDRDGRTLARGDGAPLTRSALLAEVARLCGEPAAGPDAAYVNGKADGIAEGRREVLDALESRHVGPPSSGTIKIERRVLSLLLLPLWALADAAGRARAALWSLLAGPPPVLCAWCGSELAEHTREERAACREAALRGWGVERRERAHRAAASPTPPATRGATVGPS